MSFLNTKTTVDLAENIKLELKQGNYVVFFEIKSLVHKALAMGGFKPSDLIDTLIKLSKDDGLDFATMLKKNLDELKEFSGTVQAIWDIFLALDTNDKLQEKFWELIDGIGAQFWSEMPWMQDGKQLWAHISKYKHTLL